MNVQKRNDVSIYCLSSGPTLPEWLGDRARRNLSKKDEQIRRRIELLQEFQMPASSSKICQSADGRYIIAAGTYPPRIRCYDVQDLSMKFERYTNANVLDMVLLREDYGKMALLLDDRTISFHAHYGNHETIRIPSFGRGMAYEPTTCELLVPAKGGHVYRVNLEEGRFHEPWSVEEVSSSSSSSSSSISPTCIAVNQAYPVAAVGCDDGTVRLWDNRSPDSLLRPMLTLDVDSATVGFGYYDSNSNSSSHNNPREITCIAHDNSGMHMAVGTGGGLVALYDVRSSRPLYIQEHKHGLPIHTARFHAGSGMILSADERLIKVWRYKTSAAAAAADDMMTRMKATGGNSDVASDSFFPGNDGTNTTPAAAAAAIGSVKVNIEGTGKLSHFIVAGDESDSAGDKSGVILCATADQPKMQSFYVPALGIAPKWCSFLENITEELQERDLERNHGTATTTTTADDNQETIYENYKFVSRDDLDRLGIAHLVGTPLLRGYMHGFFMDINLYNRVKAVANPFEYEAYQKNKIKERLEAKRSSRISPRGVAANDTKKKKTAVNPDLAERLQGKAQGASATKGGKAASQMLADSRFGNLFTNKDYQIDEEDENFKLRNPSGVAAARRRDVDSDDDDDSDDADNDVPASRMGQDIHDNHDDDDEDVDDGVHDRSEGEEESDSSDDDGIRGGKVRGEAYESMKATKSMKATRHSAATDASQSDKKKKKKRVVMYEADDLDDDAALGGVYDNDEDEKQSRRRRRMEELNMPISKRFAAEKAKEEQEGPIMKVINSAVSKTGGGGVGSKEVSYVPLDARKKREQQEQKGKGPDKKRDDVDRNRRGVKDLGLRKPSGRYHYKSSK